jgi:hypothetical protein
MALEVTGKKSEKTENGVTTYTLTLKICNKGDKDVKIKIASNAWMEKISNDKKEYPTVMKDGKPDPGATRKEVIEKTWKNPETGGKEPLAIAKGECKEYKLVWKSKPISTYIDIFLAKPDGDLEEKFEGGGFNKEWDGIELATYYPEGPKQNYCCLFPLAFPMALEQVWGRDIKIAIDKITGIPDGIQLLSVFPPMGIPYHLDVGDRGSVGNIILRQVSEMNSLDEHEVEVTYRVVEPSHLSDWYRTMTFTIIPGKNFKNFN